MSEQELSGMEKAFSSEAMGRRDNLELEKPTTWLQRFVQALSMLCRGKQPPIHFCEMWMRHEDINGVEPLQEWAVNNSGIYWATGIGIIEAAEAMADTPIEGAGHELKRT